MLNSIQGRDNYRVIRDFAGEIYMDSGTSNGKAGQFFTPYNVSHLMAKCNFDTERLKAEIAADPDHVITIAEPTCGAGGLIVAAMDVLKNAGINYAWNAFVDAANWVKEAKQKVRASSSGAPATLSLSALLPVMTISTPLSASALS